MKEDNQLVFPYVEALGCVERSFSTKKEIIEGGGKDSSKKTRRYYLLSKSIDAKRFGHYVRGHWQIENNLHWMLDVVFNDDSDTVKSTTASANMGIINHMIKNRFESVDLTKGKKKSLRARKSLVARSENLLKRFLVGETQSNTK